MATGSGSTIVHRLFFRCGVGTRTIYSVQKHFIQTTVQLSRSVGKYSLKFLQIAGRTCRQPFHQIPFLQETMQRSSTSAIIGFKIRAYYEFLWATSVILHQIGTNAVIDPDADFECRPAPGRRSPATADGLKVRYWVFTR